MLTAAMPEINPHSAWDASRPPDNKDQIWAAYRQRFYGRVLELGPLDGRDTVHLAGCCERLSAIEGRGENAVVTRRTCDRAGVYNVTLHLGNLETMGLWPLGWFDAVWCVGVLYHLPEPWRLVREIASVTNLVYGWSHLAEQVTQTRGDYRGRPYLEGGAKEPLSGLSPESFWIAPVDFPRLWTATGFDQFEYLKPPAPHPNGGLSAQFIARRAGS